jgi:hypothetical protein
MRIRVICQRHDRGGELSHTSSHRCEKQATSRIPQEPTLDPPTPRKMFTKAALISLLVACVRAGALENALRASVELKLTQVSVDQMTAAPGLVAEIYADKLGTPRTSEFKRGLGRKARLQWVKQS